MNSSRKDAACVVVDIEALPPIEWSINSLLSYGKHVASESSSIDRSVALALSRVVAAGDHLKQ